MNERCRSTGLRGMSRHPYVVFAFLGAAYLASTSALTSLTAGAGSGDDVGHTIDGQRFSQERRAAEDGSGGGTSSASRDNADLVREALEAGSPDALQALLIDRSVVFWVDWREQDDAIVEYCEAVLQTGALSAAYVESDNEAGFTLRITFRDKETKVPLVVGVEDRHITLRTLNQVLAPEFEIRYVVASCGSDSAAFLPLAAESWSALDLAFGDAVRLSFQSIRVKPNLFTDPIDCTVTQPASRGPKGI